MKIILVMGLPGAGKTTLADEMAPLLNAKRLNADEVRKAADDWDFSQEGRVRQAKRMADAALKLKAEGYYVIADFIAPTPNASFVTQLGYVARPEQLSTATPNTWIGDNAPEALLYAVLIQAYSYTKGPLDMLQYYEKSYTQAVQALGVEQQGRRRRDEYRDGMLRLPLKSVPPSP